MGARKRLVTIVGGGYAGALCAVRLARKTRAADGEIVLVEARATFVERIRLHQDVAGAGPRRRAHGSLVDCGAPLDSSGKQTRELICGVVGRLSSARCMTVGRGCALPGR